MSTDGEKLAEYLSDAYFAWKIPRDVHRAVAERLIDDCGWSTENSEMLIPIPRGTVWTEAAASSLEPNP